jgi:hypothetical protein
MQFPHRTSDQWRDLIVQSSILETVIINTARVDACLNECILSTLSANGSSVRQGSPGDVAMEDREEPPADYVKPQNDGIQYQTDSVDYGDWGGIIDDPIDFPYPPETKYQSESQTSESRTPSRVSSMDQSNGDGDGSSGGGGGEDEDEDDDNRGDVNFLETGDGDEQEEESAWEGDPELLRAAPDEGEPGTRRYSKVDYRNMARFVRRLGGAPYPEEWDILFNRQVSGCHVLRSHL